MVVGRPESQEKRREDKIIIKLCRRGVVVGRERDGIKGRNRFRVIYFLVSVFPLSTSECGPTQPLPFITESDRCYGTEDLI